MTDTAGSRFRSALNQANSIGQPLKIVGTINAYCALLAEKAGHKAIYVSGAGVANASYGLPDLGITTLHDVLIDVDRITNTTDVPVLVDIDIGWGGVFHIARTIRSMIQAGVAAVHIEDQIAAKRCGHRPNKQLVATEEMVDRLKAIADAKNKDIFVIARTDALASEGLQSAIDRANSYAEQGADGIFAEAFTNLDQYKTFCDAVSVPVLANITEFGKTPLFNQQQLADVGVAMMLYPLSAFRAMSKAAALVYQHLHTNESQQSILQHMQTREQLYDMLGYYDYERCLDAFQGTLPANASSLKRIDS